jgi:serine protease
VVFAWCLVIAGRSPAASLEYNPIRRQPVSIGPEANRFIVGFRTTRKNAGAKTVHFQHTARSYTVIQAQTTAADVSALVQRVGLPIAHSRQFTPSMHVLLLPRTLYGADVLAALTKLRADPAVQFADVDQLRYPLLVPTNPLFAPTPGTAAGQWYMNTPGPATVEGVQTTDYSATDAVSAWNITTGSPGIVIADVDTGILFDHPDLLRAGLGGRLLPGYDFVSQDYSPNSPYNALGTYDVANDGDGWDPDPSDPGDWITQTDIDNPNQLFASDSVAPSSWHGTRVVGVFGAITDNDLGTAGMTWGTSATPGPWVLPVRALGKGGGYDSDIIAGIEWAAGLPVTDTEDPTATVVPDNPYPADIINLSLGGESTCPSSYQTALSTVTSMGVLIVASAGNSVTDVSGTSSVEAPANCSSSVPGLIAVAGLRNVGTKVGYSSSGPEVGVSAPAGNCINSSGACLRSIETTTDLGTTVPLSGSNYSYTNELTNADDSSPNLGTSFSAPIVSGIAALMRSVNDNLTPVQLVARLEASAAPFPANTANLPTCPTLDPTTDQCSCLSSGQCGAGMVDAYTAVQAAQEPIAAVAISSGSSLNASGSAASCGRTIASYAWAASGGASVSNGSGNTTTVSGSGTVTLTVTDNLGGTDTASISVASGSASSSAPTTAGSSPCPTALTVSPTPPTVSQAFSPASVGETIASTLTFMVHNANAYALTQSNFSDELPSGVTVASSPAPATTCGGAYVSVAATSSLVTLSDANVPAHGSCTVTVNVSSSSANTYTNTISANSLTTGPAGANTDTSSSTLTVTAPASPTVAEAFSPSNVGKNVSSTLTITLSNSNAYALTAVGLSDTLPGNLTANSSPAATTTCGGTLPTPTRSITLSGGTIPASGSCTVTVTVRSGTAGSYTNTIGAGSVKYAPAGGTTTAATATLTVTASNSGGGALDWIDILFVTGVLFAGYSYDRNRPASPAPQRPGT